MKLKDLIQPKLKHLTNDNYYLIKQICHPNFIKLGKLNTFTRAVLRLCGAERLYKRSVGTNVYHYVPYSKDLRLNLDLINGYPVYLKQKQRDKLVPCAL